MMLSFVQFVLSMFLRTYSTSDTTVSAYDFVLKNDEVLKLLLRSTSSFGLHTMLEELKIQ